MQKIGRNSVVGVILAAVSVLGAPMLSGAWAAPKHGTTYADETSGGHVALVLSKSGREVKRAFVAYRFRCSDGVDFTDFESFKSVPVSTNRRFRSSYDTGPVPGFIPGSVIRITGMIKGRRNASGTKVSGKARFTFVTTEASGAKVTCDTGTISYSAKD